MMKNKTSRPVNKQSMTKTVKFSQMTNNKTRMNLKPPTLKQMFLMKIISNQTLILKEVSFMKIASNKTLIQKEVSLMKITSNNQMLMRLKIK
jgi:hypothetical protein